MTLGRWLVWAGVVAGPSLLASQHLVPLFPRAAAPAVAPLTAAAPRAVDYGDYASATLTAKAWEALARGEHDAVEAYVRMCLDLYANEAKAQEQALTALLPREEAASAWALNDAATSSFILGESLRARRRFDEARPVFERIVREFRFAQCWDPRGWFWSVAQAAQIRLDHALKPAAP